MNLMLYLSIDKKQIKLLLLKRSILGQYELNFFEKTHEVSLVNKDKIVEVDLLASAIKEGLNFISFNPAKDKETALILPQNVFHFLRLEVPVDIAPSAIVSFVKDKVRVVLSIDLDECHYDFFIKNGNERKQIMVFALEKDILTKYQEVASLLELKLTAIVPETLTYFKLFEKTLKLEKKESIFYTYFGDGFIKGYLYDTFGLVSDELWLKESVDNSRIAEILKEKINDYIDKGIKLNRIILSGPESEKIRQDTFTKAVGVWVNPLKRIIPNFYQDYLKMLVASSNKPFPILNFDTCFGAFIFSQENKDFSILRNKQHGIKRNAISMPKFNLTQIFKKEVLIFIISFFASFVFFVLVSKYLPIEKQKVNISQAKISPTLAPPTATPTLSVKREEIKIKVLNGSGTKGKASDVKDILNKKGYQEILTGNADNFDYETTEIKIKKSEQEIQNLIKNDLKDYVSNIKFKELDEKEASDVIIIVGKDFK